MDFKDLPKNDRPREKLKNLGPGALTNSELLAIIIGTGTKKENVLDLSTNILKKVNLKKMSRISSLSLQKNLGIGEAKASQICACFELGRRLINHKEEKIKISKAKDVASILIQEMSGLSSEHLKVIFLNARKSIINTETIKKNCKELESYGFIKVTKNKHPSNNRISYEITLTKKGKETTKDL